MLKLFIILSLSISVLISAYRPIWSSLVVYNTNIFSISCNYPPMLFRHVDNVYEKHRYLKYPNTSNIM